MKALETTVEVTISTDNKEFAKISLVKEIEK